MSWAGKVYDMNKMYGSNACPDTIYAIYELRKQGLHCEYREIGSSMMFMREFLHYRETDPKFIPVRENGGVGVPFFVMDDGRTTLDIDEAFAWLKETAE